MEDKKNGKSDSGKNERSEGGEDSTNVHLPKMEKNPCLRQEKFLISPTKSIPLLTQLPLHRNLRTDAMLLREGTHEALDRLDRPATPSDKTSTILGVGTDPVKMHSGTLPVLHRSFLGVLDETGDDVFEEFLDGSGGFHVTSFRMGTKKGASRMAPPFR
jgi:hypothetical protein